MKLQRDGRLLGSVFIYSPFVLITAALCLLAWLALHVQHGAAGATTMAMTRSGK